MFDIFLRIDHVWVRLGDALLFFFCQCFSLREKFRNGFHLFILFYYHLFLVPNKNLPIFRSGFMAVPQISLP